MRPALSGKNHQMDYLLARLTRYQTDLALFAQIIARLAAEQGGRWKVQECGTCLSAGGHRFLTVELPAGPSLTVALFEGDVLSTETPEKSQVPLQDTLDVAALRAWIQGISPAQE